ncbi:MAG TPA: hypothetical protein VHQ94_06085 [Pyrinomonadaceae bacterium]|jgi:hypothetical protein|nr:hypothetical protein [Pyrinomonadaceae bacterium]
MASEFPHVRPGEVITSDLMNRIIDKLAELDERIGGGGGPTTPDVITGFNPALQQAVGGPLTIFGNFDGSLAANTVMIDSTVIPTADLLGGSRADRLIFNIPKTIVVASSGFRDVTVSVQTTTKGSARRPYRLTPFVPSTVPEPRIDVVKNLDNAGAPDNMIEIGRRAALRGVNFASDAVFTFIAHDLTTGDDIRLTPSIVSRSATEIVFNVPTNVPGASNQTVSATMELVVTGAPRATKDVFVMAP